VGIKVERQATNAIGFDGSIWLVQRPFQGHSTTSEYEIEKQFLNQQLYERLLRNNVCLEQMWQCLVNRGKFRVWNLGKMQFTRGPLRLALMGGEKAVLVKRAFQIASWDRSIISQIDVAEQSHFRLTK